MPIQSMDDYMASAKQVVSITKTATRTSVALQPFSVFDLAGNPGAGTLAGSNTTAGVVPTDAVDGYPVINAFGSGAKGYISRVGFNSSVPCRIGIYDRIWLGGAYAFNDAVTLASQPSFASRIANSSYSGLQIWVEAVTAFTGTPTVQINYTNENNTAGRTTGAVSLGAALTVGRMFQMPLQASDNGVRTISSITGTVATAGTFNVMVLRPLWEGRVPVAGSGAMHDMLSTGLPEVFANSSLFMIVSPDSTSTGIPSVQVEIANK